MVKEYFENTFMPLFRAELYKLNKQKFIKASILVSVGVSLAITVLIIAMHIGMQKHFNIFNDFGNAFIATQLFFLNYVFPVIALLFISVNIGKEFEKLTVRSVILSGFSLPDFLLIKWFSFQLLFITISIIIFLICFLLLALYPGVSISALSMEHVFDHFLTLILLISIGTCTISISKSQGLNVVILLIYFIVVELFFVLVLIGLNNNFFQISVLETVLNYTPMQVLQQIRNIGGITEIPQQISAFIGYNVLCGLLIFFNNRNQQLALIK